MACASADVQQDIDEETATYGADLKSGLIVGVAVERRSGALDQAAALPVSAALP